MIGRSLDFSFQLRKPETMFGLVVTMTLKQCRAGRVAAHLSVWSKWMQNWPAGRGGGRRPPGGARERDPRLNTCQQMKA